MVGDEAGGRAVAPDSVTGHSPLSLAPELLRCPVDPEGLALGLPGVQDGPSAALHVLRAELVAAEEAGTLGLIDPLRVASPHGLEGRPARAG